MEKETVEKWIHEELTWLHEIELKIYLELIKQGYADSVEDARDKYWWMVGDVESHSEIVNFIIEDRPFFSKWILKAISKLGGNKLIHRLLVRKGLFYITIDDRHYYFLPE